MNNTNLGKHNPTQSISDLFYSSADDQERQILEGFRIDWERRNGPVDFTKRYISSWSNAEQEWLLQNEPERYWNALAPFVKEFLREKCQYLMKEGRLDNFRDGFVELFVSKKMGPPGPLKINPPEPHSKAPHPRPED